MPRKQYIVRLTRDERTTLSRMIRYGHQAAWRLQRARILLKTDTSGPDARLTDWQVAAACDVAPRTVARTREAWCTHGWEALNRRPRLTPATAPTLAAADHARVGAVACSAPPDGYAQWSLRLLTRRVMELEIVDTISHETVRQSLNKTSSSPGPRSAM